MIDVINGLDCSADELFCMKVNQARPLLNGWLSELVANGSSAAVKRITDTVISLKNSMRRPKIEAEYSEKYWLFFCNKS